MALFQPGQSGNPAGRPKGIPDRRTKGVKEALEFAFNGMGGEEGLLGWARENPDEYYKLWIKMLPNEVAVTGQITHIVQPKLALSSEAALVIDQIDDEPADLLLTSETA